jgi:hypothetical protein
MTETNLNIVLSNALCCSSQLATKVAKLYDTGSLCVDTEFDKLKLLIDRIEALKCYNFPIVTITPNINSEFFTEISGKDAEWLNSLINLTIQLNVNGTIYTLVSDGVNNGYELIINKLTQLGFLVFYTLIGEKIKIFSLVLTCNIINISFISQLSGEIPLQNTFSNTVPGSCSTTIITPAQNCLTEEQADIMMHDIMRQCDICDCQLTT